jgi:hypothetical protein
VVSLALSVTGCTTPSTPTPDPDPQTVASPTNVTIAAEAQLSGTTLTVRWESTVSGAAFVVHLGSAPGSADIGSFEAGAGWSYVVNDYQGRGRVYARVHARRGDRVSSLSSEASTAVYRLREAIDALFLANGRMSPAGNNGCGNPDRMRGFSTGSHVVVLAGAGVSDDRFATISEFLGRVPDYTSGRLSGTVARVPDAVPPFGPNQISLSIGDPTSIGCAATTAGCFRAFIPAAGSGYFRAEIVVRATASAGIYRHELGHAVMGLCHMDQAALGTNTSVMTPSVPDAADVSAVDLAAMRPVFQSSVQPGQERGSFIAAGLVDATPTFGHRGPAMDLVIVGP